MARHDVRRPHASTAGRSGSVDLDEAVFGIEPNVAVMHQVVTAQLAAARSGTQSTKTRAEVSRRRQEAVPPEGDRPGPPGFDPGAPLGRRRRRPRARSPARYRQRTPQKMIQLALRSALSDRASPRAGSWSSIEWPWTQPKTADAKAALAALGLDGKVLVVAGPGRGRRRLPSRSATCPHVQLILTGELNAYDVLCNDWIVFTRDNLPGTATRSTSRRPRRRRPRRRRP